MSKGKQAGFLVYYEPLSSQIDEVSNEQLGELFRAMFNYSLHGELPEIKDTIVKMLWATQKHALNVNAEKYKDTVQKRRFAALIRWAKDKGIDTDVLIAEAKAQNIDPVSYVEQYVNANACTCIHMNAPNADIDIDTDIDTDNRYR